MTQEQKESSAKVGGADRQTRPPAAGTDNQTAPGADQEAGTDDAAKLRKEAANYRRKLREAEGERDQLSEQLSGFRRGEVERLASESLADPADLWRSGVEVEQLLGEDGALDGEKVSSAVQQLVSERPHYRKQPAVNFDGGAREPEPKGGASFGEAMKQAAGR